MSEELGFNEADVRVCVYVCVCFLICDTDTQKILSNDTPNFLPQHGWVKVCVCNMDTETVMI